MELTHLEYFIAVADELHFGRAAQKLHIAQPPLSQQIKRLENELNVSLFKRSSRHVELTKAGKMFLPEARAIVERAKLAEAALKKMSEGKSGYLSIAFNEPAQNTFLPMAIKNFMSNYPEVQLAINEAGINEQFAGLDDKSIHLGFMRPFGYDISSYSKKLVLKEKYVLALPENHSLCDNTVIKLEMLNNEKTIMFPRSIQPQLRECFDQELEHAEAKLDVIQELNSKRITLALVATGIAIAFVPESSITAMPGLAFRELESNLPPIEIYAIWRQDNDLPLIKNFLKAVN